MDSTWISVSEAARVSERSKPTIRRWTRQRHLESRPGPVPAHGGSPPTLINRDSLMVYLAKTEQIPREATSDKPVDRGPNTPGNKSVVGEVTTVDLAHELELVKVRGELAVALAEADGLRQRLEDAQRRTRDFELLVNDTRQERDDWRDRHDAREAELRVLQGDKGLPWWRKLIGTRPVYELPDSAVEVVQ